MCLCEPVCVSLLVFIRFLHVVSNSGCREPQPHPQEQKQAGRRPGPQLSSEPVHMAQKNLCQTISGVSSSPEPSMSTRNLNLKRGTGTRGEAEDVHRVYPQGPICAKVKITHLPTGVKEGELS